MDATQFDRLARTLSGLRTRRAAAWVLGGAAAFPLLDLEDALARKKQKKKPVCLNGKTIKAKPQKRKKLLRKGATPGACPPACQPQCQSGRCGQSNGCGGMCQCPAGSNCHEGTCKPQTVRCSGPTDCALLLKSALQSAVDGTEIVLGPGLYPGNFEVSKTVTLIGAGPGADPATATILDGQGQGIVVSPSGPGRSCSQRCE